MLQVGDAKNLRRTLLLTVQLAEMGLPLALGLNMMDEAAARGMSIDAPPWRACWAYPWYPPSPRAARASPTCCLSSTTPRPPTCGSSIRPRSRQP